MFQIKTRMDQVLAAAVAAEIVESRGDDAVCGFFLHNAKDGEFPLIDVARKVGLAEEMDESEFQLMEIPLQKARIIVTNILHLDLAYHSETMPLEKAQLLCEKFFGQFSGAESIRIFTNGDLGFDSSSWNPITTATFDTGVIVQSKTLSGIFWVKGED
jgi:hypothetical protein